MALLRRRGRLVCEQGKLEVNGAESPAEVGVGKRDKSPVLLAERLFVDIFSFGKNLLL